MLSFSDLPTYQWILIGLISSITWFLIYVQRAKTYWERQGINGPKCNWPRADSREVITKRLINDQKRYGKVYGTYKGLQPALVVSDPELLKTITVKDFQSWPQGFGNPGYLHPSQSDSLVNLYGDKWKRMRSLLSPTFSSGKIKRMFNLIKNCNQSAQKQFAEMTKNGQASFDPKRFWSLYNLDVITKCCFGTSLDVYSGQDEAMVNRFINFFDYNMTKMILLQYSPKFIIRLFKLSLDNTENLEFVRDVILSMVEKRRSQNIKVDDFLQLLMDLENEIDDEAKKDIDLKNKHSMTLSQMEIVAASSTFLLAGFETTSSLLNWACYRLAMNQKIQQRLYDEISKADILDYEVLSTLPYLDAVINETLRIDPPILVFQRHNQSDYVISGTNAVVPKGTTCSIPVYAIHHDPDNYPDPEVFDPERFIDQTPKPLTFLPFGNGPRTCIGMRFALVNAKLALSLLVLNYQLVKTPKTENLVVAPMGITMNVRGLEVGIKPRKS